MLATAYLFYATTMVLVHPRLIYPFGPDRFEMPGFLQEVVPDRQVHIAISDGPDKLATLFFMGNGGALAYFGPNLNVHRDAGRTIAAMEYPGGGGIPGKPSEKRLKADALAAFDWLSTQHEGPIVVHGYSMGTGLALHVAAERDVAAIILDAPFVKMCELMTRAAYVPACYMPWVQRWNSADLASRISAPVLVQHGIDDDLIPMKDGQRLAGLIKAAGIDVTFYPVDGANHVNLPLKPGYRTRIDQFLEDAVQ